MLLLPLRIEIVYDAFAFLATQSLVAVWTSYYLIEYQTEPNDATIFFIVVFALALYAATSAWRSYHPSVIFWGLLLFFVGLLLYGGVTITPSNYVVVHSTWHVLTAIAAALLLQTHPVSARADAFARRNWRALDCFPVFLFPGRTAGPDNAALRGCRRCCKRTGQCLRFWCCCCGCCERNRDS